MASTLPRDLPDHLSRQVDPVAGYTRYDEILESIGSNVIRCPLSLEATKSMCLFNDRCYDTDAFEVAKERSASACRSREQRGLVCVSTIAGQHRFRRINEIDDDILKMEEKNWN